MDAGAGGVPAAAGLPLARRGARPRPHSPRHQAREHLVVPARSRRRLREGARLRPRQAHRGRADGHDADHGRGRGGHTGYMAPEIALGQADVDGRADIYSLGCVAYYLLTGQHVFSGDTPVATVLAHVQDAPVPPRLRSEFDDSSGARCADHRVPREGSRCKAGVGCSRERASRGNGPGGCMDARRRPCLVGAAPAAHSVPERRTRSGLAHRRRRCRSPTPPAAVGGQSAHVAERRLRVAAVQSLKGRGVRGVEGARLESDCGEEPPSDSETPRCITESRTYR